MRLGLVDVEAPNGERWDYHVVHLGRIAVALIVDDQDRALMVWGYRFVTEQWGYELLGGLVDAGEDAAVTAAREAESGWRSLSEPEDLVSFEGGTVTHGEDVIGLPRGLLVGGTAAVVAPLWDVRDVPTARLATALHQRLRAGEPVTRALRDA